MEKVSLLMKDSSEGDSQKETMIDFILSWTLRRSVQQYSEENPVLYQYCRKILGKLIGIEMTDDVQAPADKNGKWVSPAFTASAELRAAVKPSCGR